VFLALFVADEGGTGWLGEWLLADVLYALGVGAIIGGLGGYLLAALAVRLRDRDLLDHDFDGWLAIGAVLLVYGVTEVAGGYGFLAAFAAGLGFRRYERGHEVNRRVHDGAEMVEKFGELAIILLVGSAVTLNGLEAPGWTGWLLVPVLILVIRPLSVLLGPARARRSTRPPSATFVAWFGVRGIARCTTPRSSSAQACWRPTRRCGSSGRRRLRARVDRRPRRDELAGRAAAAAPGPPALSRRQLPRAASCRGPCGRRSRSS
jgi:NhaP-type Na+/H+ or K+/H+ antiporter